MFDGVEDVIPRRRRKNRTDFTEAPITCFPNKLHITEEGTAQLRLRKQTIPKYLTTLSPAGVTGDLSTSIENVPLTEFVALSVALVRN